MKRSYSVLGLMSITAMLCANALIGCSGSGGWSAGCGTPCPKPIVVKEKVVIPTPSPIISPFVVEEFIYAAGDPLDGLNGPFGWASGWSDFFNTWNITDPGLTHPAQTSNTTVSGNNKVTGTVPDESTARAITTEERSKIHPRIAGRLLKRGRSVDRASFALAERNLSAASVSLVNSALNSPGGLWFRFLTSVASDPGGGEFAFLLALGDTDIILLAVSATGYALEFDSSEVEVPTSISPDATYMFIVNLALADAATGTFTAKLWVLDPNINTFSLNSSYVTASASLGSLPINYSSTGVLIFDDLNDSFDEFYMATSPQGLNIKVSP